MRDQTTSGRAEATERFRPPPPRRRRTLPVLAATVLAFGLAVSTSTTAGAQQRPTVPRSQPLVIDEGGSLTYTIDKTKFRASYTSTVTWHDGSPTSTQTVHLPTVASTNIKLSPLQPCVDFPPQARKPGKGCVNIDSFKARDLLKNSCARFDPGAPRITCTITAPVDSNCHDDEVIIVHSYTAAGLVPTSHTNSAARVVVTQSPPGLEGAHLQDVTIRDTGCAELAGHDKAAPNSSFVLLSNSAATVDRTYGTVSSDLGTGTVVLTLKPSGARTRALTAAERAAALNNGGILAVLHAEGAVDFASGNIRRHSISGGVVPYEVQVRGTEPGVGWVVIYNSAARDLTGTGTDYVTRVKVVVCASAAQRTDREAFEATGRHGKSPWAPNPPECSRPRGRSVGESVGGQENRVPDNVQDPQLSPTTTTAAPPPSLGSQSVQQTPRTPSTSKVPAFSDLGDAHSAHRSALRSLAADGVFAGLGCGGGRLCPNEAIPRWEMAVALVRVVDGQEPAAVRSSRFSDVAAGRWWAAHTERLAGLGVTAGCATGPLRYCPDDTVTRAQTASFLKRAFSLPAAVPAGFADTAGSVHEADIDALYAAGITAGCSTGPLKYCPGDTVTRAQMASFLSRAVAHRDRG